MPFADVEVQEIRHRPEGDLIENGAQRPADDSIRWQTTAPNGCSDASYTTAIRRVIATLTASRILTVTGSPELKNEKLMPGFQSMRRLKTGSSAIVLDV